MRRLDLGDVYVEEADRIGLERFLGRLVAFDFRQPADAVALIAAMQGRTRQVRDGGLQGIEAIVERQKRVSAESHGDGLFLAVKTVERGSFGPIGASWTKVLLFHFATVLGLMPWRSASSLAVAFDRCIAARMACVVVALP